MKDKYEIGIVILYILILIPLILGLFVKYDFKLRKIEEESYKNKQTVEETARNMIAQYESDRLTYEQYKDNVKDKYQDLAESAKTRANNTAIKYNEYMLKNEYIWKDNIPKDIYYKLEIIGE